MNTSLSATAYASPGVRSVCGIIASDCRFEAPAFMISAAEVDVRRGISVRNWESRRAWLIGIATTLENHGRVSCSIACLGYVQWNMALSSSTKLVSG